MKEEELKNKCKERAKIFQQAMESCHSSSPIDCIEWFADRITELEKENAELKEKVNILDNCDRLGDVITEEYKAQLTKAKELLKRYVPYRQITDSKAYKDLADETEQFLEEIEK